MPTYRLRTTHQSFGFSAPFFGIFDIISRGITGSQTREEALEQAKKYQNSTPTPGESHRSFALSVFATYREILQSEKLLPPEEVIVTPNQHQFNPSMITIQYWRSNAILSAHPGTHTILHQAEIQLSEISNANYPITLRDDFQKDTILKTAAGLDRINIGTMVRPRPKTCGTTVTTNRSSGRKPTKTSGTSENLLAKLSYTLAKVALIVVLKAIWSTGAYGKHGTSITIS